MLYKNVLKMLVIFTLFQLPAQALPQNYEINQAGNRICNSDRKSSESIDSIIMRETGKWLYNRSITIHEVRDKDKLEKVYGKVIAKAYDTCPLRFYELKNNYTFKNPNNSEAPNTNN